MYNAKRYGVASFSLTLFLLALALHLIFYYSLRVASLISSPGSTRGTQLFVRRGAVTADSAVTEPHPQCSTHPEKKGRIKHWRFS